MTIRWATAAAVFGASLLVTSSAVAHANPATPMAVIDSSAADLCGAINANPSEDGVMDGLAGLQNRALDETDAALIILTAMHHVCPQHESLLMDIATSAAAEEVCATEPM